MNARVESLRRQSVETKPYISTERAELVTEFYRGDLPQKVSAPVCRALALAHLIERRTIYIGDGELIVGERGPAPKATPTYPELCCHSLEDLRILNRRERTPFVVSQQVLQTYEQELIPFWSGRSLRDRLFGLMSEEWKKAFQAGVFTEFMEQRAPGHLLPRLP
jgi:pyruvate-formate lyase